MSGDFQSTVARVAEQDFHRARRKAFRREVLAALKREPNWLMSFDEVQRLIPLQGQQYRGIKHVPVSAIIGSVGRYQDFDRSLADALSTPPPLGEHDRAALHLLGCPPVQLYKWATHVVRTVPSVSVTREGVDYYAEVRLHHAVRLSPATDPRDRLSWAIRTLLEQTKPISPRHLA